jgi:VIT1/CCC1 family predicted Fe2+/Mn2+ transporter
LGGPLSGIAAHWWRQGRVWQRVAGVSFLSGVFVGEGTYYLLALKAEKGIAGVVMILVGVILSLLLGRNWRDRALNLVTLPVIVLLVLGFYNLLNQVQF